MGKREAGGGREPSACWQFCGDGYDGERGRVSVLHGERCPAPSGCAARWVMGPCMVHSSPSVLCRGGACPRPQFLDLRRSVGASPRPAPSADAGGRTPLIRHGFAVPPSPRRGEGFGGRLWGPPLRGISALCVILEVQGPMGASGPAWRAFLLVLV